MATQMYGLQSVDLAINSKRAASDLKLCKKLPAGAKDASQTIRLMPILTLEARLTYYSSSYNTILTIGVVVLSPGLLGGAPASTIRAQSSLRMRGERSLPRSRSMTDLFSADTFVPGYLLWLAIRYVGLGETFRIR